MVKKYIHINLNKPFFHNIYDLYFLPINKNYIEYSYKNYEYKYQIDNKICIFNGSFRDNYFLITLDVYDIYHDNSIYNKNLVLIQLDWELNSKNIYVLKINEYEKINKDYIFINLRKELNNNNTFSIDELLDIKDYNKHKCTIKYSDNISKSFNDILKLFF